MRNWISVATLLFALASAPALADETTEELAQKYVGLPEVQSMFSDMFSPQSMAAQVASQFPPGAIDDSKLAQIGELLSSELNKLRPRMENVMATKAAEVFTSEELQALIDFYQSPHGGSVMAKMQPYFQQYMAELGPEFQAIQIRIAPKVREIIESKQ